MLFAELATPHVERPVSSRSGFGFGFLIVKSEKIFSSKGKTTKLVVST